MTNNKAPTIYKSKALRRLLRLSKKRKLPKVTLLAHVSNQATGEASFEIGFQAEDRKWKSIRAPKEQVLHYPAKTRDLLSKFDAVLPRDQKAIQSLMRELADQDAPNWWCTAPALGWQGGGSAFVLHDRVLGKYGDGHSRMTTKLIPPDKAANDHLEKLQRAGNVKSWKKEVAGFARWSSPVALAISAAFAAPLLSVVDWPTFMVVLYGEAKVGKSTAALAGATVIGIGHERDLPNWNLTGAALPQIACCFNDILLVLNGLESTNLKDAELREFLRSVTYILGDGVEKRRHSSWSAAQGEGGRGTWRTIALVTSENSFDEIATRANDSRLEGERARSINVEATVPNGTSIIDIFPSNAPKGAAERAVWARSQVEALRAACARNHGDVLKFYLDHVIKQDRGELKRDILECRDAFVAKVNGLITTEALNHAAKNMGVIYAGGVQAIRAGLLPLTEEMLSKRIRKCFKRSVQAAAIVDPLMLALRKFDDGLRDAVARAGTPEITALMAIKHKTGEQSADEFTVHVNALFSKWLGDNRDSCSKVLHWLSKQGLLELRDRTAAARAGFTIESVRHTRRIQGKNCATVVFRDPRPRLREIHKAKSG